MIGLVKAGRRSRPASQAEGAAARSRRRPVGLDEHSQGGRPAGGTPTASTPATDKRSREADLGEPGGKRV